MTDHTDIVERLEKDKWHITTVDLEDAIDEITRLRAEAKALRKDAERYRHMRKSAAFEWRNGPGLYWYLPRWDREKPNGERLDAAIDAAIAGTKEQQA